MSRAVRALLLLLVAAAAAVASAADVGVKAPPPGPPPAAPRGAAPAVPSSAPLPAATPPTATTPPSACCATLAAANFTRTPGVPVVIIAASTVGPPSRAKQNATLCTCGAGDLGTPGAPIPDWAGPILLKNRGGTNTQRYNTIRQYAAYLPKEKGGGNGTTKPLPPPFLLGLDGASQLIFLGQVNDTGGVKESMGRDLARAMGGFTVPPSASPYATWSAAPGPLGWVPRTVHVELFLADDGQPPATNPLHYRGLYLASEHIDQHTLDLPKAGKDAPRSAAIATFMHGEKDPEGTTITGPVTKKEWQVKWPDNTKLTPSQAGALNADLSDFETALFLSSKAGAGGGGGGNATTPNNDWRAWMDEPTFIDWFLHAELWKVAKKSYHSAAFMHKPAADAKWTMGPVWAQLQGAGTCCGYNFISQGGGGPFPAGFNGPGRSGGSGISPTGWLFSICREPGRCTPLDGVDGKSGYDVGNGLATWFGEAFFADPRFAPAAAARWVALRAGPWSDENVDAMLKSKQALIGGPPLARTLARWEQLRKPWVGDEGAQAAAVFSGVGGWLSERLAWLDAAFVQAADPAARDQPYPVTYKK